MGFLQNVFRIFIRERVKETKRKSEVIRDMATKHGYELIQINTPTKMLRFKRADAAINVYVGTMTVTTEVKHPTRGKTQLHRRGVSFELLDQLFQNPRLHTGRGYYKKD